MIKRGVVIITMFYFAGLLFSCIDDICDKYKYTDFDGINIDPLSDLVTENDSLLLRLSFSGTKFISQNRLKVNFFNKAYASFDCDQGWGGYKYPLVSISIKSDADFNSEFLANTELSSIVKARGTNSSGAYILDYIDQFQPEAINPGYFYITLRPEINKTHKFTIKFEKSNGETLSATSDEIVWE